MSPPSGPRNRGRRPRGQFSLSNLFPFASRTIDPDDERRRRQARPDLIRFEDRITVSDQLGGLGLPILAVGIGSLGFHGLGQAGGLTSAPSFTGLGESQPLTPVPLPILGDLATSDSSRPPSWVAGQSTPDDPTYSAPPAAGDLPDLGISLIDLPPVLPVTAPAGGGESGGGGSGLGVGTGPQLSSPVAEAPLGGGLEPGALPGISPKDPTGPVAPLSARDIGGPAAGAGGGRTRWEGENDITQPRLVEGEVLAQARGAHIRFDPNLGQFKNWVDFTAQGGGYRVWLSKGGAVVALINPDARLKSKFDDGRDVSWQADVVGMTLAGANPSPQVEGLEELEGRSNFFLGSDASKWRTDVPGYARVTYRDVYPNVDLTYHGSDTIRQLEFDFVVRPGGDPGRIGMDVRGGQTLRLTQAGDLEVDPGNGRTLVQHAPVAYQLDATGRRLAVAARFVLSGTRVTFEVGPYDTSRDLVIDPVLKYGTFLGGRESDRAFAVAADAAGNSYVTGVTLSPDFPTANAIFNAQIIAPDVFVSKLSASSGGPPALAYSTYLGGSGPDYGRGIAVDGDGSAYVTGTTQKYLPGYADNNFPVTTGAYQIHEQGSFTLDGFVTKLSSSGSALSYSTYVGTATDDFLYGIAVTEGGQAVVAGKSLTTGTSTFDAVVKELNASGSALDFSITFAGTKDDVATAAAVDSTGGIAVAGWTASSDFPGSSPYQASYGGGAADMFVARLGGSGGVGGATYFGGPGDDRAFGVAVDGEDFVYAVGQTDSSQFPTVNPGQSYGGAKDAVVVKWANPGARPVYSTFLGGSLDDWANDVATDSANRAVVVGATASGDFPAAYSIGAGTTYTSSGQDAFATRIVSEGGALDFSSKLRGRFDDEATGVGVDGQDTIHVAGWTFSPDFPTRDSISSINNGNSASTADDAFVVRLGRPKRPVITAFATDSGAVGDHLTNDPTLFIYGTSDPGVTVTVLYSPAGNGGLTTAGTTTADGSGNWTFDFTGTSLAQGAYDFYARATGGGETSDVSDPYRITIDLSPPVVTLTLPTSTFDTTPVAEVTATDNIALLEPATANLDVDLNNDGDFLDTGEAGYTSGTLTNGFGLIEIAPALALGTVRVRARVKDKADNEGTSPTATTQVIQRPVPPDPDAPWSVIDGTQVGVPPSGRGPIPPVPIPETEQDPVRKVHVDLPGSEDCPCQPSLLVYNASTTSPTPTVQATVKIPNAVGTTLPPNVIVKLIWDGSLAATTTFTTLEFSPGDEATLAIQPLSNQSTGRHTYTLDVTADYPGTANDVTTSVVGSTFAVNQNNSEFGAGWNFSNTDRLYDITSSGSFPAGKLRAYGRGTGWGFYEQSGSNFISPLGDPGTLSSVGGGGYQYVSPSGTTVDFNAAGVQTKWTSANGAESFTYEYQDKDADGAVDELVKMTAGNGTVVTFAYSGTRVRTMEVPFGRTVTLTHSGSDLTQITDPAGNAHTFTYDAAHKMTGETYGAVVNAWTYANGVVATVKDHSPAADTVTPVVVQGLTALVKGKPWAVTTDATGRTYKARYDRRGQMVEYLAPDGGRTKYDRDANEYVTAITDPLGRVTSYTVDGQGYVTKETHPDGGVVTYTYQAGHHALTGVQDERGNWNTFTYDAAGNVRTATDPFGKVTTYSWDNGLLTSVQDALGRLSTQSYDAYRRLLAATRPGGAVTTVQYDAPTGEVVSTIDPLGRTLLTVTYDPASRATKAQDAAGGVTTTTYEASGLVTGQIDPTGLRTSVAYIDSGQVSTVREAVGTGLERPVSAGYDGAGRLTSQTDALGRVTTYVYDAVGRPTGSIDPLGNQSTLVYDRAGQVTRTIDALGRETKFQYDAMGQVTGVTDRLGFQSTVAYDPAGNPTELVDARGNRTTTVYDALNRPVAVVDALANRATTVYDDLGRVVATIDPRGNRTTVAYDTAGRPEAVIDPLANLTTTVYDAADRVLATVDELGHRTTYGYDAVDRVTEVLNALNQRTTTAYDKADRLTAVTDALGRRTTWSYDALGRAETVIDALNQRATTVYDAADQVTATIDPLNHRTTLGYDAAGRNTSIVDALARRTTVTFDAAGNLRTVTVQGRKPTEWVWDSEDQLIAAVDGLGNRTTAVYDPVGNLTAVVNARGFRTTVQYDVANRPEAVIDALANRTTSVYDPAGNVIATINARAFRTTVAYDALNQATEVTDALAKVTTSVYDAAGNRIAMVDPRGNRTTFQYDALNRFEAVQDALTNRATTVYDAVGNVTEVVDPRGNRTTVVFDALDRAAVTIDALTNRTTTTFDANDNVLTVTDPRGNVTSLAYDALDRWTMTTDALGKATTGVYDKAGRLGSVIDARGNRKRFYYDAAGRPNDTADGLLNHWRTVYDEVGNAVASVDPLGSRTTTVFDAVDRVTTSIDALANRTTAAYDAVGNTTTLTDPRGKITSYSYDAVNRLTEVVNALTQRTTGVYDAAGNLTEVIDGLGRRTTAVFDALNRQQARVDGLGNRTTAVFDQAGNRIELQNPLGNRTSWTYDALNRATEAIDPLAHRTTAVFDTAGNLTEVIDARVFRTTAVFDALNRQVATVNALGNRTTSVYDAVGNLTTQIDALNYRTTVAYDAADRPVTVTRATGGVVTTAYDAAGQVTSVTDPLNHRTTYGYDAAGRMVTQQDARAFTTTAAYDPAGNVTALVDAVGNRTTWSYDAVGRVTEERDPLNKATTVAYDAAGQRVGTTDRLLRRKVFGYDNAGRNTTEQWYASGGSLLQTQTFTYDAASRLTGAADPDGTYTLTYDAADRVTNVLEPFGLSLTFTYDATNNRTRVDDSKGGLATSTYDGAGRLTKREFTGNGATLRIDYGYTNRDELNSVTRYSDLAGSTKVGDTLNTFDPGGRLTNRQHRNGSNTVLWNATYTYDLADRLTAKVENNATTSYSYDNTDQLTKDGSLATITYDGTGNRTNSGYATATGNRMSSDGTWTYTYDDAGNVTKKSKGASAETWNYAYDHNNQLTSAEKHATDGGALQGKADYAYDAFGNRLSRKEYDGSLTLTAEERYGLDGWDTARPEAVGTENFDVWADLDGGNALTARRVYNTGFDDLAAKVSSTGVTNWYLTDNLGSVRNLTDGAGALVGTLAYDAFGKVTSTSGTTDRKGYTGRDKDPLTGLMDYRARSTYDPATGRFYSEDPLGQAAGDPNEYRYVRNFVTGATDPSGDYLYIENEGDIQKWSDFLKQHGVEHSISPGGIVYVPSEFKDALRRALESEIPKDGPTAWMIDAILKAAFEGDLGENNIFLFGVPGSDWGPAFGKRRFDTEADLRALRHRHNEAVDDYLRKKYGERREARIDPLPSEGRETVRRWQKQIEDEDYGSFVFGIDGIVNHFLFSIGGGRPSGPIRAPVPSTRPVAVAPLNPGNKPAPPSRAPVPGGGGTESRLRPPTVEPPVAPKPNGPVVPKPPQKPPQAVPDECLPETMPGYKDNKGGVRPRPRENEVAPGESKINCFPAGTPVLTPTGYLLIEDCRPGQLVFSFDFESGTWVTRPVAVLHEQRYDGVFLTIALDDGMSLSVTEDHPVWVAEGDALTDRPPLPKTEAFKHSGLSLPGRWVNSQDLRVGDTLVALRGKRVRVTGIAAVADSRPVYDLSVLGCHYYTAGHSGVLVHNSGTPNDSANKPGNGTNAGENKPANGPNAADNTPALPQPPIGESVPPVNRRGEPYPTIIDPRTGKPIPYPGNGLPRIPPEDRVPWGDKERRDYKREYERRIPEPPGGWERFWKEHELHHIRPRLRGGSNDYDNIVPVPTPEHRQRVSPWWSGYGD
ncbi:MAG TPA: SBBP repeat-containing protein [Gemmataceae bacterium]|nr:SBBP repeat-containing protein [Gemmataceae bacterium]